jgi:hypothetical protein
MNRYVIDLPIVSVQYVTRFRDCAVLLHGIL